MARKVFKEIDSEQLDNLIGKADAARKNAGTGSNTGTVVPSGQGEQGGLYTSRQL
jgi:hypothetical protein